MNKLEIEIYDCTLRDGAQAEGVDFSVDSKAHIAGKLDKIAEKYGPLVHYVEGGWPGSNPRDIEFFKRMKDRPLTKIQLVPFGSTRYKDRPASEDCMLPELLRAETKYVTIFGKSWDFHVEKALETTLENNLKMIRDTVSYLTKRGREVIFDAEHFFNGYLGNPARNLPGNPQYALETLVAAAEEGAERIILCETNGGLSLYNHHGLINEIVEFLRVKKGIKTPLGIHTHNDSGNALANTLYIVNQLKELGEKIIQVHGTWNGLGERAGNADLSQIIPNIVENLGIQYTSDEALAFLTEVSRYVYDLAGLVPVDRQPIVGPALGHKGGVHVSAVRKDRRTYEWALPRYGNISRIVVSDQAGKSTILEKAKEFGLDLQGRESQILGEVKKLEHEGRSFRGADASLYLLMLKGIGKYTKKKVQPIFLVSKGRVVVDIYEKYCTSDSYLEVRVGGEEKPSAQKGVGPVDALDKTLRAILEPKLTYLKETRLVHFKSGETSPKEGTEAVSRVTVTTKDDSGHEWVTVGASRNIIEAALMALQDAYEYGLRMYAPEQIEQTTRKD